MADLSKLKKGTPAKRNEVKSDPIAANNRPDDGAKGHIQFLVPRSMIDEFDELAYEKYGMKRGAKTQLFKDMFNEFKK